MRLHKTGREKYTLAMKEHYCQANDRLGILAGIGEHGFAIVPELLDSNGRDAVRQALTVHKTGIRGRNDFEGYQTERVYIRRYGGEPDGPGRIG